MAELHCCVMSHSEEGLQAQGRGVQRSPAGPQAGPNPKLGPGTFRRMRLSTAAGVLLPTSAADELPSAMHSFRVALPCHTSAVPQMPPP